MIEQHSFNIQTLDFGVQILHFHSLFVDISRPESETPITLKILQKRKTGYQFGWKTISMSSAHGNACQKEQYLWCQ